MADLLSIPEEKRMPDTSLSDQAHNIIALAFIAGVWTGLAGHYLYRSTYSSVWIAYFISSLVFLGIAYRRVGAMIREFKGA
jgi:hypothetical protein